MQIQILDYNHNVYIHVFINLSLSITRPFFPYKHKTNQYLQIDIPPTNRTLFKDLSFYHCSIILKLYEYIYISIYYNISTY